MPYIVFQNPPVISCEYRCLEPLKGPRFGGVKGGQNTDPKTRYDWKTRVEVTHLDKTVSL